MPIFLLKTWHKMKNGHELMRKAIFCKNFLQIYLWGRMNSISRISWSWKKMINIYLTPRIRQAESFFFLASGTPGDLPEIFLLLCNSVLLYFWICLDFWLYLGNRHDICQMFYTIIVSRILEFTREKARKLRHFRLLIWNFGNFIQIIWLMSQFLSIYAHFILNLWLKWLKINEHNSIILI